MLSTSQGGRQDAAGLVGCHFRQVVIRSGTPLARAPFAVRGSLVEDR